MTERPAILSAFSPTSLDGLEAARDLECYADGDRLSVLRMLREAADRHDGRVAVATVGGSIVGYCVATPPDADDRLYPVPSAIELTRFEIARSYRGRGLFRELFRATFGRDLDELIVYAVADPSEAEETPRAYRELAESVFGSVGMVPYPTDDPSVHQHRDVTFFARIGRGVPTPDVEDFFASLRGRVRASVAITVREPALRNLLRADLERGGFDVVAVRSRGPATEADILVTDGGSEVGDRLTVRLDGELIEPRAVNGTLWYPTIKLDSLPALLRDEILERRGRHG